jgi:hypothetical protein
MNAFYSRLTRFFNRQLIVGLILLFVAAIVIAIFVIHPLKGGFSFHGFFDGWFCLSLPVYVPSWWTGLLEWLLV